MPDEADALIASLDHPVRTSVLLNRAKFSSSLVHESVVPWCSDGRILAERPVFTTDPLFHVGCYYPQESSSMFLHHVLRSLEFAGENIFALDMCASPGGKSIILSTLIGDNGVLISNEIQKSRNNILLENLTKWGAKNTLVTCNNPVAFGASEQMFNLILVDAPCSGEGMFRKDEVARKEWSPGNTIMCGLRQREILKSTYEALRPGGFLIYSTCTFAPVENEEIVQWLVTEFGMESILIPVDRFPNVRSVDDGMIHGAKFLPHLVPGEGLFMAALKKPLSATHAGRKSRGKSVFSKLSENENSILTKLIDKGDLNFVKNSMGIVYAGKLDASALNKLAEHLYFTSPGIEIGSFIKNDFIPAHALALSGLYKNVYPEIELDLNSALDYLRGGTIDTTGNLGWCVVTYQGFALGWIKCMSNRSNNYYPKHWRIRMK